MNKKFSDQLEEELVPLWTQLMNTRICKALVGSEPVDKRLLQIYLIESYHYVKHNAQHQAMAVWHADLKERVFMRKALQHALEEVDHDQLAINDLIRSGLKREDIENSIPLPETLGFNGFLYNWVTMENPVGRLGYSIWAESTQSIGPMIIEKLKEKFKIQDERDISFFSAHAVLDMRHGQEAKESIDRFAVTPAQKLAVQTVAHTSMKLFIGVLEAMYDHHLRVLEGAPLLRSPETAFTS